MSTKKLVTLSMLIALQVVLSRFLSVQLWNFKFGFGFIPVVIAAVLMGPLEAAACGAIADFIGSNLFPIGRYFPGFTLTAGLMGLVFGFFLKNSQTLPRAIGAALVNRILFTSLLNSLWIAIIYSAPFWPLVVKRLIQCAIMVPLQVLSIMILTPALKNLKKRGFADNL
jgi:ECF transporter S component (folate family)